MHMTSSSSRATAAMGDASTLRARGARLNRDAESRLSARRPGTVVCDANRARARRSRASAIASNALSSNARGAGDATSVMTSSAALETLRAAKPLQTSKRGVNGKSGKSAKDGLNFKPLACAVRRGGSGSSSNGGIRANGVRAVHPWPLARTHDETVGAQTVADVDVVEALKRRRASGSKPGKRDDGLKIGLVVEGGGMRGVISAGAIGCLLEEGYYDAFDACYGSSAGAMNLTYYLAQQPEGIKTYEDDLCDGAFLDIKRHVRRRMTVIKDAHLNFIRRGVARVKRRASSAESATISDVGTLAESNEDVSDDGSGNYSVSPAMNVNHLLDHVMGGLTGRPLNWRKVIESKVPLKVVATSLDTLSTVILEDFKDVGDLKMCLRASARVPALAGAAPVSHRGHRLVDAAVLEPVPVHAAACDGCTHMLVMLTSPHLEPKDGDGTMSSSASVDVSQSMDDALGSVDDSGEFDIDNVSTRRANGGIRLMSSKKPKPASSALYRAIRNLLFAPEYMSDIWDVHDALAETLNRRHGWRAKDVLTPARAPSAFAPIKITTVAPNGPASKSMSSLCVDVETIAAARVEGEAACRLILGLPANIAIDAGASSNVIKGRA